ncbi:globin [Pseudomonas fluorescens]|jgi:hemoglobin|uniref:Group 1 truncated hemoglobin n=4 Tax=Pseudomonas TaxID=286 RepID=A0A5M9IP11_9PSED|nr:MULTISPECIES: group 1 truncated hemoglobin [Pseudomonas]AHC37942.1 globin [Pseudomonas sp. TKP]AOE70159.1 globin [Pseudomonas fluorescens]AOE75937.1 globin [Pseudomonas fluorescens]KAA6173005.1 group 1 truncated hemoglobin [Pseudomonas veronii]KAA6181068.1 group 1 truncated hemoglobin [Pseudomonas veronii]
MTDQQPSIEQQPSLYTRLGGYDVIYQFAGAVLRKTMAHPVIGHIWAHMSESTFQKEHINFVDFLSQHWGGSAKYRGRDMVTAHRGMGLTEEHWQATLDCLEECYNDYDLAPELRKEVNDFLVKFKPAVIGSPSYRDVVLAHPEMDPAKGMKSVGVIWPKHGKSAEQETVPKLEQ